MITGTLGRPAWLRTCVGVPLAGGSGRVGVALHDQGHAGQAGCSHPGTRAVAAGRSTCDTDGGARHAATAGVGIGPAESAADYSRPDHR